MHFGYFGPNIGLSDPFGAMSNQKNNTYEVPRWISDDVVIRTFAPFKKFLRCLVQKLQFLPQNMVSQAHMRQLQMFQKVEYVVGPIFKVVLKC